MAVMVAPHDDQASAARLVSISRRWPDRHRHLGRKLAAYHVVQLLPSNDRSSLSASRRYRRVRLWFCLPTLPHEFGTEGGGDIQRRKDYLPQMRRRY